MSWCHNMRTRSGVGRGNRLSRLLCVTTELFDRRPAWAHRQCRRGEVWEFFPGPKHPPPPTPKIQLPILDFFLPDGEKNPPEDNPIVQPACGASPPFSCF